MDWLAGVRYYRQLEPENGQIAVRVRQNVALRQLPRRVCRELVGGLRRERARQSKKLTPSLTRSRNRCMAMRRVRKKGRAGRKGSASAREPMLRRAKRRRPKLALS